MHVDPIAQLALWLAIILVAAKLGGDLAVRIGQPAVLGELVVGVVLGNLGLASVEAMKHSELIDRLAGLGVLLLLFEVGLESTVKQMLAVGWQALIVALLGVVAPFALGWAVGAWLLPEHSPYVHAFLGATLCATSVGITARVLQELGRTHSPEARIILGAAVIDDVMGLVVLAIVTGVIAAAGSGVSMGYGKIFLIAGNATVFLVGGIAIGIWLAPRLFGMAAKLRARGVLLTSALAFCFVMSWLAGLIGLAPIVGAFAAGLILEDKHFAGFSGFGEKGLEELVHPITSFLVPVFFVLMGLKTDLRAFGQPGVLGLAAALTVAAVIGKQACALGVPKGINRMAIGIGMIPRGEVGLIFANVGLTLMIAGERIVDPAIYSAVVVMVIVTTLMTPPLLKRAFRKTSVDSAA